MVGCFSGLRAIWPANSILALKLLKTAYHGTGTLNVFQRETNAVHNTDDSVRDSVYVGLYPADGGKLSHRLAADINLPI